MVQQAAGEEEDLEDAAEDREEREAYEQRCARARACVCVCV